MRGGRKGKGEGKGKHTRSRSRKVARTDKTLVDTEVVGRRLKQGNVATLDRIGHGKRGKEREEASPREEHLDEIGSHSCCHWSC